MTTARASPEGWWLGAATLSKSIRYDSAIDGHCAAYSSANLRQASSNRRSMSRGWLAERTGTTRPRRRRRAVRHMPYLPHRTHQLALRARRGSQPERHRLSAGPQRKPSSSFFSRDARARNVYCIKPVRAHTVTRNHVLCAPHTCPGCSGGLPSDARDLYGRCHAFVPFLEYVTLLGPHVTATSPKIRTGSTPRWAKISGLVTFSY